MEESGTVNRKVFALSPASDRKPKSHRNSAYKSAVAVLGSGTTAKRGGVMARFYVVIVSVTMEKKWKRATEEKKNIDFLS
jgi:hypothetical protein